MPRFLRETSRDNRTPDVAPSSSSSSSPSPASPGAGESESLSMAEELQRRKAAFLAHFKSNSAPISNSEDAPAITASDFGSTRSLDGGMGPHCADSKCHVCNAPLRLLRLRHRCRNCGQAVCGVHSKNQVPLPHLGIMKEVRVCDLCTRQLVQRRAGYRSPKNSRSRQNSNPNYAEIESDPELSPVAGEKMALPLILPAPGKDRNPSVDGVLDAIGTPDVSSRGSFSLNTLGGGLTSSSAHAMPGILYSCLLEEQDNTMDEILYLGTFTMGGRSLASRRMSANVALWKWRIFMLTTAEMLCFKATGSIPEEDSASMSAMALGEVRSSVHLSDILHIEVNDQFPRILTVIRSDGRVFRVRARTPEQCTEIALTLRKAMQLFQDALFKLQRGPQPEDNSISCVSVQHESSLPESVVVSNPAVGEVFQVDMYPSSILRFYVNGPSANGTALFSREMLTRDKKEGVAPIVVEAEPLGNGPRDDHVLHVAVKTEKAVGSLEGVEETNRRFWGLTSFLAAVAAVMNSMDNGSFELLAWLSALVLFLTRFHERISLLLTTRRFSRAQPLRVECVSVTIGKSEGPSEGDEEEHGEKLDVDTRFLAGCEGDVEEAKERHAATMKWRKENDVGTILLRPSHVFTDMKECFTHFTHKKDRLGHPISFEFLGGQRKALHDFTARGVTEDEAIMHHVRMMEFMWNVIDPRPFPEGNMLKIYDIKGISMADMSSDVVNYTKKWGEVIATYNPERVYQVFIINPPAWFNLIWKLVSPLVNPKTRERIHVLRGHKDITKALLEFVAPENLPKEYGGECQCEGGCFTHSPEENDIRQWTEFVNANYQGDANDPVLVDAYNELCEKYRKQLSPPGSSTNATPVLLGQHLETTGG
ncbi:CRAL/TRIO domain [Phytophthora infestans]|uniref:CRAL/TRIO domain n=1 Tax=Phytophthora infestans TaxID=4787 RepID=A0A8S9UIP5_PHYIN|nr:CRAL/TRIO domain [Phytophthora infestans]